MKIVYETERVAKLREVLRELDAKELDFLMQHIEREKDRRKQSVFSEWLEYIEGQFVKELH